MTEASVPQEAAIRERRLGSLIVFEGSSGGLAELGARNPPGCCRDNTFNQCGDCSAQRAMGQVSQVRDTALVSHAPLGCAADFPSFNATHRRGMRWRGLAPVPVNAVSSNLTERDLIMGGHDKLRAAIDEAFRRFRPRAIFVSTSCASGIIGDDIEDVASAAEARLGVPVVPVYCEGFKSMVWTSGFDAGYHGIFRKLVKPPKARRGDVINVFNFSNQQTLTPILSDMGVTPRYLVHQATLEELAAMSESAASGHICETLGTYICASLERHYGVPELRCPPPYGIAWTERWIREVGRATGREAEAERALSRWRDATAPEIARLRGELEGKRVFAFGGAAYCHSMLAVAREFGVEIVGMMGFHHDMTFDNPDAELNSIRNIHELTGGIGKMAVCNKQPYQLVKLLQDTRPDLVLSRHGSLPVQAVKLGIPVFFSGDATQLAGFDGLVTAGRRMAQAVRGRNFARNIAAHARFPYTGWWMKEKDVFHFRKKEGWDQEAAA
ncbi:MAG: nitrogenase [Deltaproteobacteria bacterium]|jgi:nitrogenase molybdenum-iron protein alpha chain|nr:nitrogenase [Deltaproteobacteria bacterium]